MRRVNAVQRLDKQEEPAAKKKNLIELWLEETVIIRHILHYAQVILFSCSTV